MVAPGRNILFILGGGPRIGHSVAKKFLGQGYKVAVGRRHTDKINLDGALPVYVDVTKPETIETAFREVESKLGVPNVVVYNGKSVQIAILAPFLFRSHADTYLPFEQAAALTFPPENDPFGIDPATFERDLTVNAGAAYAALHYATRLARGQGKQDSRSLVFIATGNVTPFQVNPFAVTLGPGKSALAHLIELGTAAYDKQEFR